MNLRPIFSNLTFQRSTELSISSGHDFPSLSRLFLLYRNLRPIFSNLTLQRDEAKLIDLITECVLKKLNYTPLHIDPIRIDWQIEEVMVLLDLEVDDIRMVGIHCWSETGNRTMAKVIYNRIFHSFEGSIILFNGEEVSPQYNGLASLQDQLVNYVTGEDNLGISDVQGGDSAIRSALASKRVLIVLDGIDSSQIDALAGRREWLGRGSRIIVTCSHGSILSHNGFYGIYRQKKSDSIQSIHHFGTPGYMRDQTFEHLGMPFLGEKGGNWEIELQGCPMKDGTSLHDFESDSSEETQATRYVKYLFTVLFYLIHLIFISAPTVFRFGLSDIKSNRSQTALLTKMGFFQDQI